MDRPPLRNAGWTRDGLGWAGAALLMTSAPAAALITVGFLFYEGADLAVLLGGAAATLLGAPGIMLLITWLNRDVAGMSRRVRTQR